MILLPEGLEDLSRLPVPAAPFHPEDLLRLLHRPDLPGLEDRSRPEDQRRLSHRSDLQDPEDPEDLPRLSLPEDPEDLLHPSDLQAR